VGPRLSREGEPTGPGGPRGWFGRAQPELLPEAQANQGPSSAGEGEERWSRSPIRSCRSSSTNVAISDQAFVKKGPLRLGAFPFEGFQLTVGHGTSLIRCYDIGRPRRIMHGPMRLT
jgi:hypothetical protein